MPATYTFVRTHVDARAVTTQHQALRRCAHILNSTWSHAPSSSSKAYTSASAIIVLAGIVTQIGKPP